MNNMNPVEFIALIKNRNPQELVLSMVKNNNINNTIISDLISFAQKGDINSITKIADTYFSKQGKNFMNEFNNFMAMLK